MSVLQLSQLVPLRYRSDVHPELADLNERLRYFLGGCSPSKTAHQPLSQPSPLGVRRFAGKNFE